MLLSLHLIEFVWKKSSEDNLTKIIFELLFQDIGHVLFFPPKKFPFNFIPVMKNCICGPVLLMEKQWHIIYTAVHAVSGRGSAVFTCQLGTVLAGRTKVVSTLLALITPTLLHCSE